MKLSELGAAIGAEVRGEAEVLGITHDSRRARAGDLFCAIPGFRTDGHRYIEDARRRGAVACLVERWDTVPPGMPGLLVLQSRAATARAAAVFFGHPSRLLWMVGVTGTNGKTTTTHLIRHILEQGGHIPTGLMGTVHTLMGPNEWHEDRTTPEAPDLQATLRQMVDYGMQAVAMEVSSHSLSLHRVDDVAYDVGVFTNLTQDHLDFHRDFEDYFSAKAQLFERLGQGPEKGPRAAVLNADDDWAGRLVGLTPAPIVTYGLRHPADVRAEQVQLGRDGARFVAVMPDGERATVYLTLSGRYNVSNALAAMAVGYLRGVPAERMAEVLAHQPGVPGRFERIDCGQPFSVVVDYAHSPDGLENILRAIREFIHGRVILVFGAGGDRDQAKRPLMGAVAGRLADLTVSTTDNPRSEDAAAIADQFEAGIRSARGRFVRELDRSRAIRLALDEARPDDLVLVAGKGHEDYQIYRDRIEHFDDREEVRKALAERGFACS
jgi:UDP-N-acetylmuramoyl-L-alanyl-D-glutamate--2,6-diaminopimelate ligase